MATAPACRTSPSRLPGASRTTSCPTSSIPTSTPCSAHSGRGRKPCPSSSRRISNESGRPPRSLRSLPPRGAGDLPWDGPAEGLGRPPRSLRSRRIGFAQPIRCAGAKQCFAKSPLRPPEGAGDLPWDGPAEGLGRPPRSLRSRRIGFAQPIRCAGAKQCFAKPPLRPPRGPETASGAVITMTSCASGREHAALKDRTKE